MTQPRCQSNAESIDAATALLYRGYAAMTHLLIHPQSSGDPKVMRPTKVLSVDLAQTSKNTVSAPPSGVSCSLTSKV